jgi:hypothetical protein
MISVILSSLILILAGWNTKDSQHFAIHYQSADRTIVNEMLNLLEDEYSQLTRVFGNNIYQPVDVYVHPNQSSMVRFTKVKDPSQWLLGLAVNGEEIHIVSPLNAPGQRSKESVLEGMIHELVHICVAKMLPDPPPLWLNEGLAVYYAHQRQFARQVPGIIRARQQLPLLREFEDQRLFERNNGYPLSYTIVEFIISEYGEFALKEFLIDYPDYGSLGLMSEMQFENAWHRYLSRKYLDPEPIQRWYENRENVFEAKLFPNPISSEAQLEFFTGQDGIFSLRVLDPWGEPMQTLYQRPLKNGFHGFKIEAGSFPPGIYYLEMVQKQQVQLIRFIKD